MKFVHTDHSEDLDGARVTIGVTRRGEVWIQTSEPVRLSPDMAAGLAGTLAKNAVIACGHAEPPEAEIIGGVEYPAGVDPFGDEAYKYHRPGCECPDCRAYRADEAEPGTIIGTDVRIAYDDEDDEAEEYDPGPEVDDEGGMSEYRHHEPEPWS